MHKFVTVSPGSRSVLGTTAFLLGAVLVTGCQPGTTSVLPSRGSASVVTPTSTLPPSSTKPHDVIVATYLNYWKALAEAGRSSPDKAHALLGPYVGAHYLDHLIDGVREMDKQGREPYGEVVPRVKEVRVGGKRAEVIDCQDTSRAGMADRRTHQLIPGTIKAKATANIAASLEQSSDGRWRLTGVSIKEAACTPPSH